MNYYNENDKFAANWLRELIKAKLIPEGEVDDRSITDIEPEDLAGFKQCHFFAGIGGWSRAFELSGWDADRLVWSGSCPCQSLSCAGKGLGEKDERHLWPVFFSLIEKLRPSAVFGEQVASKDGREWLSGVRNDLEAVGYAVGAADLPAASVSSPHKRNRLFWVADSEKVRDKKFRQPYQGKNSSGEDRTKQLDERSGNVSFWSNSIAIPCADGKWRRVPGRVDNPPSDRTRREIIKTVKGKNGKNNGISIKTSGNDTIEYRYEIEPALFPLADGIQGRVGLLRGIGNAIVPQAAAEFIGTFMEIREI